MSNTIENSAPVKVYAFCNSGMRTDMQGWMAMAETGDVICSHLSSSRAWGIHDVSPAMHAEAYEKTLGAGYAIDYIVVDEGQAPPADVVEKNRLLGEMAAAEANS